MNGSPHLAALRVRLPRCVVLGAVALVGAGGGCSRQHFRERADKDVEGVISQKNIFPDWKVENWHVYPDARARFADPSHPDFPPYPPDDYAAYLTSPNPQRPGRGGMGRYEGDGWLKALSAWDAQNRAEDAAQEAREKEQAKGPRQEPAAAPNQDEGKTTDGKKTTFDPDRPGDYRKDDPADPEAGQEFAAVTGGAAAYLRTFDSKEQPFRIRVDQAVELAVFNSREFQDRREDLYLAALPVTLERYGFAAQAFASEQVIRQSVGREFPGGGGEFWRINTDVGFTRTFATGGELLVRLANQIVIDVSGPAPQTSISNLGLTFIQPLLRGGGFAVTLEALTQAERTLLYAIRSYARFRKVFYAAIVGQGNYTNNPYGLQGLAGNLGRGVGANLTAQPTGYLPTVLQASTLANARRNVAALEQFLRLYQNLLEGGGVNQLQVTRVERDLLNSRANVLTQTRIYLDNIDFFKLQLGVPATAPVELDDTPVRPIRRQLARFEEVFAQVRELEREAGRPLAAGEPATAYRNRWARLLTDSSLARGTRFAQQYRETADRLRGLSDDALAQELAGLLDRRQRLLDARAERQVRNTAETPAQVADLEGVEAAVDRNRFERALRRFEAGVRLDVPPERRAAELAQAFQAAFELGFLVAAQPRAERLAGIRRSFPALPPVVVDGVDLIAAPLDDAYTKVAQAALVNRLDLMNARAQVVDAWRQTTVTANALRGVFDVRYDLESTTPRDEAAGLAFSGDRTRHTVTLRYDPPFVRRAERNQYRASLIGYQRSRRNLQAFEDNVITDSRQDLRQLRQLAETYALQQRLVELTYSQVDNARSTLLAPPDPAASRGAAGDVAALTQQLLEAQNALLQAQNNLYTTWVTYQTVRIDLFLDLELLPLDARGIWTDGPPAQPADPPGGQPAGRDPGPADPGPGGQRPPGGERLPPPRPAPPGR